MQDNLRAGDRSFPDRLRRFGGGVPRCTDAYWAERADDVDAWPRYRVEKRRGSPTLFVAGSCAEFHWAEIIDRPEGRIYIATGGSADLRADATRRHQAVQDYSLLVHEFPQERLTIYLKAALTPVFGVHHYRHMFEFAKSRGEIHFRLFSICEDNQPNRLPREMEGGESQ